MRLIKIVYYWWLWPACQHIHAYVLLRDPSPSIRWDAIETVGNISGGFAAWLLVRQISSGRYWGSATSWTHSRQGIRAKERQDTQPFIASALERVGEPAVPMLIRALRHPDRRFMAARLLRTIGDKRAIVHFAEMLEDTDWILRENSAVALAQFGDVRSVPALIASIDEICGGSRLSGTGTCTFHNTYREGATRFNTLVRGLETVLERSGTEIAMEALQVLSSRGLRPRSPGLPEDSAGRSPDKFRTPDIPPESLGNSQDLRTWCELKPVRFLRNASSWIRSGPCCC